MCGKAASQRLAASVASRSCATSWLRGVMYDSSEGVPQDHAEAARWYRKAAEQGDPDAQFNLGVM